ncbi:MAG: DUF1501 domain-containing protein [Pseudomonadota bacterium]
MLLTRRIFTTGLGAATLVSGAAAGQAGADTPKLVLILLRGAMDGLTALPKLDDRHIQGHRQKLIPQGALPLTDGFAAHPKLANWHGWFKAGEAAFVHAVAGPYRERSHFKAQDLLETGAQTLPGREGWLNRLLQQRPDLSALSIGPATPMILQGKAAASSWSPAVLAPANDDTLMRLEGLYASDALFAGALAQALETNAVAGDMGMAKRGGGALGAITAQMEGAGRLLAKAGGPDIAVIDIDGWDTHSAQMGRLGRMLEGLDTGLGTLKAAMGAQWGNAAIAIVSEFGRTVRENGGGGTDHGTAGVALLAGGKIKSGQHGDWPGLAPGALYEGRDLYPANDMNDMFAGLLAGLYGVSRTDLRAIFPAAPTPMLQLV